MPKLSDGWVLYLAQLATWLGLLWTVLNSVRTRDHATALDSLRRGHEKDMERLKTELRHELERGLLVEESRLRVASELRLRLHQESWTLLRQIQDAAFKAFEGIRSYQSTCLWVSAQGSPPEGRSMQARDYETALGAVQSLSGLSHCAPPEQELARRGASAFTGAFNAVNAMLLNPDSRPNDGQLEANLKTLRDALGLVTQGTAKWNQQLWRAHTDAISVVSLKPSTSPTSAT